MTITIRIPSTLIKSLLTALVILVALLTLAGAGCVTCMDEFPRWAVLIYGISLPLNAMQYGEWLYTIWHGRESVKV